MFQLLSDQKVPATCKLDLQASEELQHKLQKLAEKKQIKLLAIFRSVEISSEDVKNELKCGCFLVTDTHLYLTKSDFSWMYENSMQEIPVHLKQPMTNLVELDAVTESTFILNFMDETEDRTESWKFEFETKSCIDNTLASIDSIWSKLFGVPLQG